MFARGTDERANTNRRWLADLLGGAKLALPTVLAHPPASAGRPPQPGARWWIRCMAVKSSVGKVLGKRESPLFKGSVQGRSVLREGWAGLVREDSLRAWAFHGLLMTKPP